MGYNFSSFLLDVNKKTASRSVEYKAVFTIQE